MKLVEINTVETELRGKVTIASDEEPASLEITGADVDGLPNDYVLSVGSMLFAPGKVYIATDDGSFSDMGGE